MNINKNPLTGKEKQPLTRADVEDRLRRAGSSRRLNLANATLAYSDLSNLNLTGVLLVGADLTGAILHETILSEAKLTGAIFNRANLNNAILTKAILNATSLVGASLIGANLSRANLAVVKLTGANLSRANLSGAKLMGANLSGANLTSANLTSAKLMGANLNGANLSNADFTKANLNDTNLQNAIFTDAYLVETKLDHANFDEAGIGEAIFHGAYKSSAAPSEIIVDPVYHHEQVQQTNIELATHDEIAAASIPHHEQVQQTDTEPTIRIHIEEEPLIAYHLLEVLNSLVSLYVKMWLLQHHRFDDFMLYTERKESRFEEEANLIIAELSYNSPAFVRFLLEHSPGLVKAFQSLATTITQAQSRKRAIEIENRSKEIDNQLKEEMLKREQIKTIEEYTKAAERMVNTIYPDLNKKQKSLAMSSFLNDMLRLHQNSMPEISLTFSPAFIQSQSPLTQTIEAGQTYPQLSEPAASLAPKEGN